MHFLNRLLILMIVFVFITLIIGFFMPKLRQQKELAERQEDLKRQIAAQKTLLNQRLRQEDWLKDPAYVETIARDRLDLMKDGETILRIEPQASPTPRGKAH